MILSIIINPRGGEFIMNKTDLINAVAEQADLTKKEAGLAVDEVFESIQS